ncbi:acyl-CoA N-acyltransferase [Dentipellis sp. KUC8613]|nr:acyl-CoA N-acyltransferase [Dentipellis sp. KUC8613]
MSAPSFETARLTYHGFTKADFDEMFEMYSDPAVQHGAMMDGVLPRSDAFRTEMEGWAAKNVLLAAVREKGTGAWVGKVSLHIRVAKDREGEATITFKRRFWGKGYGAEAMRWLVDQGFRTLNLHRVALGVFGSNLRAIALYKKVGFVEEGRKRKGTFVQGKWEDLILLGILDEEYWAKHEQKSDTGGGQALA